VPHPRVAAVDLGSAPRPERASLRLGIVDTVGTEHDPVEQGREIGACLGADLRFVDRHLTPSGELDAFLLARGCHRVLRRSPRGLIVKIQEGGDDTDALRLEVAAERVAPDAREELPGHGYQDPGAVAREPVGGDRLPVTHAGEPRERELDDLTAAPAVRVSHEADAAGVDVRAVRVPAVTIGHGVSSL